MSTTQQPLKFLWSAYFEDGRIIHQPADDRYSKHVEGSEYNPSAFRDVLEYSEKSPLMQFALHGIEGLYAVHLRDGVFATSYDRPGAEYSLEDTPLTDRKVIFFRQVRQEFIDGEAQPPKVARYCLGYEGKNAEGKVEKKVIYIDG